jgi:hypothetical protein
MAANAKKVETNSEREQTKSKRWRKYAARRLAETGAFVLLPMRPFPALGFF